MHCHYTAPGLRRKDKFRVPLSYIMGRLAALPSAAAVDGRVILHRMDA